RPRGEAQSRRCPSNFPGSSLPCEAAAGSNNGNFLDNDKWLSTVSQYDKDKYWNKFRDVSTPLFFSPAAS
uniref:Testican-1 n=1 Tax=Varanus komodoensis TaxID=61221 RepID=A0A8D2LGH0_VARKO